MVAKLRRKWSVWQVLKSKSEMFCTFRLHFASNCHLRPSFSDVLQRACSVFSCRQTIMRQPFLTCTRGFAGAVPRFGAGGRVHGVCGSSCDGSMGPSGRSMGWNGKSMGWKCRSMGPILRSMGIVQCAKGLFSGLKGFACCIQPLRLCACWLLLERKEVFGRLLFRGKEDQRAGNVRYARHETLSDQ